jgi:RNA polymerase sigma factor (TIGR02999 family)
MEAGHGEITVLLQRWRTGDRDAESHLFELLIPDLRKIAGYCLRGERRGHSMQSTLLVNEAFLRLANANQIDWQDRSHFLAVAARIMRHYLIDHARHKGSVVFMPIDGLDPIGGKRNPGETVIAINLLLDELQEQSPELCEAIELKFFLGLNDDEAAEVLGLPLRTFQRRYQRAKIWLFQRLQSEPANRGATATNV